MMQLSLGLSELSCRNPIIADKLITVTESLLAAAVAVEDVGYSSANTNRSRINSPMISGEAGKNQYSYTMDKVYSKAWKMYKTMLRMQPGGQNA
jgi:hypothetical protein